MSSAQRRQPGQGSSYASGPKTDVPPGKETTVHPRSAQFDTRQSRHSAVEIADLAADISRLDPRDSGDGKANMSRPSGQSDLDLKHPSAPASGKSPDIGKRSAKNMDTDGSDDEGQGFSSDEVEVEHGGLTDSTRMELIDRIMKGFCASLDSKIAAVRTTKTTEPGPAIKKEEEAQTAPVAVTTQETAEVGLEASVKSARKASTVSSRLAAMLRRAPQTEQVLAARPAPGPPAPGPPPRPIRASDAPSPAGPAPNRSDARPRPAPVAFRARQRAYPSSSQPDAPSSQANATTSEAYIPDANVSSPPPPPMPPLPLDEGTVDQPRFELLDFYTDQRTSVLGAGPTTASLGLEVADARHEQPAASGLLPQSVPASLLARPRPVVPASERRDRRIRRRGRADGALDSSIPRLEEPVQPEAVVESTLENVFFDSHELQPEQSAHNSIVYGSWDTNIGNHVETPGLASGMASFSGAFRRSPEATASVIGPSSHLGYQDGWDWFANSESPASLQLHSMPDPDLVDLTSQFVSPPRPDPQEVRGEVAEGQQGTQRLKRAVDSESSQEDHPQDAHEEADGDGRRKKAKRALSTTVGPAQGGSRKFACPYFKRNPKKYRKWTSCPGPGWDEVHRVKTHLYRRHALPIQCPRCWIVCKTDGQLQTHLQQDPPCSIQGNRTLQEGFTKDQEKKLRSRKKTHADMTDEDNWREIYAILFPDDDSSLTPSPYYTDSEKDNESRSVTGTGELEDYATFIRREMPGLVRRELETLFRDEFRDVEERVRPRIAQIVLDLQPRLLGLYKQSQMPLSNYGPQQHEGTTSGSEPAATPVLSHNTESATGSEPRSTPDTAAGTDIFYSATDARIDFHDTDFDTNWGILCAENPVPAQVPYTENGVAVDWDAEFDRLLNPALFMPVPSGSEARASYPGFSAVQSG